MSNTRINVRKFSINLSFLDLQYLEQNILFDLIFSKNIKLKFKKI